ncbi:MAG: energy-coupling factor ABC transporter permease [Candidatus Thorarchaeota archaeon]
MHVPDGVVPLVLQILMYAISLTALYVAVRRVNKRLSEKTVPYVGVLAAVVFAAQFVNFPVPPSSGHLVGSTMVAVMLGPWAGILVIALVLFVQAMYGDGGILTYGLNLFNMGVFSCLVGWGLSLFFFKGLKRRMSERTAVLVSTSAASYIVTVAAAFVLGLELQTVPGFGLAGLVAITSIHALIGIGEAILTFVILLYFVKARPQVISFLSDSEVRELAKAVDAPWAEPST